jgi:hypothetical protein
MVAPPKTHQTTTLTKLTPSFDIAIKNFSLIEI